MKIPEKIFPKRGFVKIPVINVESRPISEIQDQAEKIFTEIRRIISGIPCKKLVHSIYEIYKNSCEHNTYEKCMVQIWNSIDYVIVGYWKSNTSFYNSSEIKEKLEKREKIPSSKSNNRGGHGTRKHITQFPDHIFVDTRQEAIFIGYKKSPE